MSFVGRYINMDASVERRQAFEIQLDQLGHAERYTRFKAVDGRVVDVGSSTLTPTELGCLRSHYQCVLEAAEGDRPTHIVEDDVVFAGDAVSILDEIVGQPATSWDLLFTDIIVPMHFNTLLTLIRGWRASGVRGVAGHRRPQTIHYLDLAQSPFAGSASYLVSTRGAKKLAQIMAGELARGATMQTDMLLRHHVCSGELSAACTIPFLTSVDPSSIILTTITGRKQHQTSALALFLLRYYFFYGRSDEKLRAIAAELDGQVVNDETDLLWPAIRHAFSENTVEF